jgi:hypothetical protein
MGGTLANLRGYAMTGGGSILGATVLTGQARSAKLSVAPETLAALRRTHGDLESWWQGRFGHAFDCLTESEARYLARTENADRVRSQLAEAERS